MKIQQTKSNQNDPANVPSGTIFEFGDGSACLKIDPVEIRGEAGILFVADCVDLTAGGFLSAVKVGEVTPLPFARVLVGGPARANVPQSPKHLRAPEVRRYSMEDVPKGALIYSIGMSRWLIRTEPVSHCPKGATGMANTINAVDVSSAVPLFVPEDHTVTLYPDAVLLKDGILHEGDVQ